MFSWMAEDDDFQREANAFLQAWQGGAKWDNRGARIVNVTIRRARLDEAGILTDLSMRAKRSNGYDDDFMEACRSELTVTVDRLQEGEYWIAEASAICGCVCLKDEGGGHGEVHAFFIDPNFQRRGIGRSLWLKVAGRAKALGIKTLDLDADPAACAFYRAMGFVEIGEAPSGSVEGRMLPRMRVELDQLNLGGIALGLEG